MAEVQTPAAPVSQGTPTQTPQQSKKKRRKILKVVKNIVVTILVLAILAAAGWGVWYFVFREDPNAGKGEPIFDTAQIGSIATKASGYGSANAKSSASIVLTQDGVVEQLFVSQGQMVYEGDPLYVISSEKAEKALADAQEALVKTQESYQSLLDREAELRQELARLQNARADLTVKAPHPGKLLNVSSLTVGQMARAGETIATIVDDTKLRLSLYYSYAYENDIHVGDTASVSVPVIMQTLTGKVEKINKVKMITPEGGVNFEVILVVDNLGTMTEGMAASATMYDKNGDPMYPYEDGTFTYYQTTTVTFKQDGTVSRLVDLINYAEVKEGQSLVVQNADTLEEQIRAQQKAIDDYQTGTMANYQVELEAKQKAVEEAEKGLQNFSAVSPITGMVTGLALYEGMEVSAGSTAIMIADNSVMTVNIQVDDRNRQYIDVGDELELNDWYGNTYIGVVDSIAVIGENQNGVTVYPAVLRVDNPSGTLMGGYGLNYSFVTAHSDNCILIPSGDIRYYTPEDAEEPQGVVFVKLEDGREPPAVTIDKEDLPKELADLMPEGCVAVPVETGLTDTGKAEITSGLTEGDQVWNSTPSEDGRYNSWG